MSFRGLAILLASALAAWPQTPAAQNHPEITSQEASFTFSSRVNLVSAPVVVRDRDGHAVGNLKKEDFQLFDKGKPQLITKFSLETAETRAAAENVPGLEQSRAAGPAVLPDHFVAYLFDDVHLTGGDLLQSRQAVNRHLDESLEPAARAAIFTTSGLALTEFTNDREKLHKAVNSIEPYTSGIDQQNDCPSVTYYEADLLTNKFLYLDGHLFTTAQLMQIIQSGTADQSLLRVYAEAKACIPCSGTNCAELWLDTAKGAVHKALTYGNHETDNSLGALRDVIRKLSGMPGNRNLVLVSPGFLLTIDHRSAEYDLLDRAIKANVTVNTIDMRGLFTTIPGGSAEQRTSSPYDATAATQADDVLEELADGTGGSFFHNDNRLKEGLNQLAARPEYVYVLGFSPDNLKYDGSYHTLKVALRNSAGLTLVARRGYWAPKREVNPAEAAREALTEAVFSRDDVSDIPLDLQTEFFKSSDVTAELTVTARLKVESLRFHKADERNNDTVTMVAGLFDSNGNYISGIQKVLQMRLRDETLAGLESSPIAVKENFHVAPGRYLVRLVIRDAEGQAMAARSAGVEIP